MSLTSYIVDQEMAKTSTPAPDLTNGSLLTTSQEVESRGWMWDGTKKLPDGIVIIVDNRQHRKFTAAMTQHKTKVIVAVETA